MLGFFECLIDLGRLIGLERQELIEPLLKPGKPMHAHRERIILASDYYQYATAFGWTPNQVKEIDPEDLEMLRAIMTGVSMGKE